jgi:hypothetical protein
MCAQRRYLAATKLPTHSRLSCTGDLGGKTFAGATSHQPLPLPQKRRGTKDSIVDLFADFTDFKVRHKREEHPSRKESSSKS